MSKDFPFNAELFDLNIRDAISGITDGPLMQCNQVTVKGTAYKVGYVVILAQGASVNDITFGVVKIILMDRNQSVFLVTEEKISKHMPSLQAFSFKGTAGWKCLPIADLVDYQPLSVYERGSATYVTLKHGLMLWG